MPKDLFSEQSIDYAKYRPSYPPELFDYILQFVEEKNCAWDCATGNGQAAAALSPYFKKIEASDLSEGQIKNAVARKNIHYSICTAEQTPFPNDHFDLITVATAYHWLDWKKFYTEATRVGKQNAVIAVWAYHLITTEDKPISKLIKDFYYNIMLSYWDPERKHVEEFYANVAFDFSPLPSKDFFMELKWSKDQFKGYLRSWSAVQHYVHKNHSSPVALIENQLDEIWDNENQKIFSFPLFLKIGRIQKPQP